MFKFRKFLKKDKYIQVQEKNIVDNVEKKPSIPDGMWIKCESCGSIIYKEDVERNLNVCINCNYNFRLSARERLKLICDEGTFIEMDANMESKNILGFPGYNEKLEKEEKKSGEKDAVVTGICRIHGYKSVIAVMDSNFMMGSMGAVVGEKITRAIEKATEERLPIIIFTTSGGARMQEGMVSLMQMAKTSSALGRHSDAGLLYVTVLTDPTTGGVTASFAMLGDIILAEPGALIGFAGKRVIQQTINQTLPKEFQTAEFLLQRGFVDKIVKREDLKKTLGQILRMHR
ncbi:acetyl-CoA carboxylase, carboxyltransferase subunit beta [Haloimpatiens lingqiaonensis]|uniref:acetyl-CoA carboxylase, carboxyltransferase subunit beta n=1 Tax=Haloimpatiens lingqiaonensis TaxID=1380675 RepID=UPI0010FEA04B|nr:acetyl-CoA carboxylase, carboxyltransferase subunit beta [Haloimpatiens lingqiaonensis]